jgi:hypothetical protein
MILSGSETRTDLKNAHISTPFSLPDRLSRLTDPDPDTGCQLIADPAGSGSYLNIFMAVEKKNLSCTGTVGTVPYGTIPNKSLNIIKYRIFF